MKNLSKGAAPMIWIIVVVVLVAGVAGYVKYDGIDGESEGAVPPAGESDLTQEDLPAPDEGDESQTGGSDFMDDDIPAGDEPDDDNEDSIPDSIEGEGDEDDSVTAPTPPGGPNVQHTVTYTDSGYSPERLEVNQGDSVLFVNNSSNDMWPATDVHPTHSIYPASDIQKCFDGSDTSGLFDACEDVPPGGSWSFVFNEVGSWDYHDHNNPGDTGTIVVSEFSGS